MEGEQYLERVKSFLCIAQQFEGLEFIDLGEDLEYHIKNRKDKIGLTFQNLEKNLMKYWKNGVINIIKI